MEIIEKKSVGIYVGKAKKKTKNKKQTRWQKYHSHSVLFSKLQRYFQNVKNLSLGGMEYVMMETILLLVILMEVTVVDLM